MSAAQWRFGRVCRRWAAECSQESEERYGNHLPDEHPEWGVGELGAEIYQADVADLREIGNVSTGRKIDSRWMADAEFGQMAGNEAE